MCTGVPVSARLPPRPDSPAGEVGQTSGESQRPLTLLGNSTAWQEPLGGEAAFLRPVLTVCSTGTLCERRAQSPPPSPAADGTFPVTPALQCAGLSNTSPSGRKPPRSGLRSCVAGSERSGALCPRRGEGEGPSSLSLTGSACVGGCAATWTR